MGDRDPFPPIPGGGELPEGVDDRRQPLGRLGFGPEGRGAEIPRDPGGQDHFRVTDVREFGAGHGGDDTEAIQRAIDHSPDGGVIYFPAGTYRIGASEGAAFDRIRVVGRNCLTFVGEGRCSLLRRRRGNVEQEVIGNGWVVVEKDDVRGFFDLVGCTQIEFTNLSIDANGLGEGSLLHFKGSRGVRIHGVGFTDDRRRPTLPSYPSLMPSAHDSPPFQLTRFAVLFDTRDEQAYPDDLVAEVAAPVDNTDIWIEGNEIDWLGVGIRDASRVWVANNRFQKARMSAIVLGSRFNEQALRDINILDNTILWPQTHGIVCVDRDQDQQSFSNNVMSRIRIAGNTIRKIAPESTTGNFGFGILVGTGNVEELSTVDGSIYRNIAVEQNVVHFTHASGVPIGAPDDEVGGIRLCMASGGRFEAAIVRDNTVIGYRAFGIRLDRPRGAVVTGNSVYDGTKGIALESDVVMCHVSSNRVHAAEVGYQLSGSGGRNVFVDNTVLGGLETPLSSSDLENSDIVDEPRGSGREEDGDFFADLLLPDLPDIFE